MSRLSINHYICPADITVQAFLDKVQEAGIGAVGLSARAIAEVGLGSLRAMLHERGLAVSSVNSAGYFTRKEGALVDDHDRAMIEAAATLKADVLCVIAGGIAAMGNDLGAARARVRAGLEALAECAGAAGVRLGLEPIHPLDVLTKGCVNTIADGLAITEGLDGVGLLLDANHSWWDPALWRVCDGKTGPIALLQICNVIEPGEGGRPQREFLSSGEVDVAALIAAFDAAGYTGWYEFEIFAPDLRGRTVEEAIADAVRFLRR